MRYTNHQLNLFSFFYLALDCNSLPEKKENRVKNVLFDPYLSGIHPESAWRHAFPGSQPVDYGGSHPFEIQENFRRLAQAEKNDKIFSAKESRILSKFEPETFEPIRIKVDYDLLPVTSTAIRNKNNFLQSTVIPEAIAFWTEALSVYPAQEPFIIPRQSCALASRDDESFGVQDADLKVYVGGVESCGDGTLAAAASCHWDQFDRPIGGTIQFCYDSFNAVPSEFETQHIISTAIHELLHVFGFKDSDFPYYYDINNGLPRTPRPIQQVEHDCNDGSRRSIFAASEETVKRGLTSYGVNYYEITTPRVKQVARNQFDCQEMDGARLENQPTGRSCLGDHWEERLFFNSLMSSGISSESSPEFLTPLTLALLEDTGWYVANYEKSSKSPFGMGAGCDFVNEPCIVNGNIPAYSEGSFCNTSDMNEFGCDPTHRLISNCNLVDFSKSVNDGPGLEMQYFSNKDLGAKFFRADYCPTFSEELASCTQDFRGRKMWEGENFGSADSRCFQTGDLRPYCMRTRCNEQLNVIEIIVGDEVYASCEFDGQTLEIEGTLVECPKLSAICPNLLCKANCEGQGICNYNTEIPQCDEIPPPTFIPTVSPALETANEPTSLNESSTFLPPNTLNSSQLNTTNNETLLAENPTSEPTSLNESSTLVPPNALNSSQLNATNNETLLAENPTSEPTSLNESSTLVPPNALNSSQLNTTINETLLAENTTSEPTSLNESSTLVPPNALNSSQLNTSSNETLLAENPISEHTVQNGTTSGSQNLAMQNASSLTEVTRTNNETAFSTSESTLQIMSFESTPTFSPTKMAIFSTSEPTSQQFATIATPSEILSMSAVISPVTEEHSLTLPPSKQVDNSEIIQGVSMTPTFSILPESPTSMPSNIITTNGSTNVKRKRIKNNKNLKRASIVITSRQNIKPYFRGRSNNTGKKKKNKRGRKRTHVIGW